MLKVFNRTHKVQLNEHHADRSQLSDMQSTITSDYPPIHKTVKPSSFSNKQTLASDQIQPPVQYRRQSSLRHSNYFGHGDVYGKSSLNNTYSKKYISCENIKNIGLDLNDASRNKTKYNNFNDIVDIDELNNEDDDEAGIKEILVKRYNSLTSLLMKSFRKAKKKKKEAAANTSISSQQLNGSIYQTQASYQNQKEVSMYRKHHTNYNQMKIGAKSNDLVRRGSIISNLSLAQSHHINNDAKNSSENTNSVGVPDNNTQKNVNLNDQGENNDSVPVFLSAKVISNEFVDLNKTNHKTTSISNSDTLPSTFNDNSKGVDNIDKIISQKYHNLNQILAANNNASKNLSTNRNILNNNNTDNTNDNTNMNKENNVNSNNINKKNPNNIHNKNDNSNNNNNNNNINIENQNREVLNNDRISVTLNKKNSIKESQGDKNQYPTLNKLILKGINDSNIIKKSQENIKHEFSSHLKPHAPKIPIKTCVSVSETIDESESDDVTIKAPAEKEAPVILRNPPPVTTKTPQVLPNETASGATVRRAKTFTQQLHDILNERKEKTNITVSQTFHEPQKHATLPKERPVQNSSDQNRFSQQLNFNINLNQAQHSKPIPLQESIINAKQLHHQVTNSQCHYEQNTECFEIKSEYAKIRNNVELEILQSQANKTPRTMSINSSVTNPDLGNLSNEVLNQLRFLTSEKEKNNERSEILSKTSNLDFLDAEIDDFGLETQIYDYNDIRLKQLKTIKENDNDDFMDLVQVLAKQDDLFKKKFFDCLMTKLWDTSIPYNEYYQLNKLMIALFGESYHKFGNVSNRKTIDKLDAEDVVSLVRAYLDKNKSSDDSKLEINYFIENQIRPISNVEPQSYSSVSNLINTLKRRKKIELNKESLEDLVDKNKYSFMNGYETSSIESSKFNVNEKTLENDQSQINTIKKVDPCFREMARELLMEIKQESHELAKKAEENFKKETKSQIIQQLTEPHNFVRNKLRSTISNYQNIKLDYADNENEINLNMLNKIMLKNNESIIHTFDFSNNQNAQNDMINVAKISDLVRLNQFESNPDNFSCIDLNIKKLSSDLVNSVKRHNTITARTNFQAQTEKEPIASQIPIAMERNKLKRNSLWIETKKDQLEVSSKPNNNNNNSIIEKRDKTPINLNRFLISTQPPKPKIVSKNSTIPVTMGPMSLAPDISNHHQNLVNKTIQIRNLKEIFNSESLTGSNQILKPNNSDEPNKNVPMKNFHNDTIKKVLIIPKVNANANQVIIANPNVLKSKPVLLESQKYVSYNGESANNRKPQINVQKLEGSFPLEFNPRNSMYNVINNVGENLINRNSKIPINSSCYSNKISTPFETISRNKNISDYKNFINIGNYQIVDGNLKQGGYQINKLTSDKTNDMTFFKTIYELNTPNLNNSNRQHLSNRLNCKEMQQAFY